MFPPNGTVPARFVLELISSLDARIITEGERFTAQSVTAVDDPAPSRTPGPEGIKGFQKEVLRRHISRTEREGTDPVEITVRQTFRTVAAEEGAVFKGFVIGKCMPRSGYVRISTAHVETQHPEGRARTAARVITPCTAATVVVAPRFGAVQPPVKGNEGIGPHPVLRSQAENIGHIELFFLHTEAVSEGTEIPCVQAEIVRNLPAYLNIGGPVDSGNDIMFDKGADGKDIFRQTAQRQIRGAVGRIIVGPSDQIGDKVGNDRRTADIRRRLAQTYEVDIHFIQLLLLRQLPAGIVNVSNLFAALCIFRFYGIRNGLQIAVNLRLAVRPEDISEAGRFNGL